MFSYCSNFNNGINVTNYITCNRTASFDLTYRSTNSDRTKPIRVPLINDSTSIIDYLSLLIVNKNKVLVGISGCGVNKGKLVIPYSKIENFDYLDETNKIVSQHVGITEFYHDYDIIYKYQNQIHYYMNFYSQPKITGPDPDKQKYYEQSNRLIRDFDCEMIIKSDGFNSGLAWITIDDLVESDEDYVVNSPFIRNIYYYFYENY